MDKGLLSKDMIEYSGRLNDDEHTEEDLFEMFEILSYMYYENDLDGTHYEMAES